MTHHRQILIKLALRFAPAGMLYGTGWLILKRTTGSLDHDLGISLLGLAFIIAASVAFGIPLVRLLTEPSGSLFYPDAHFDRPQPMYGIPESKRKSGSPEEAIAGYEAIARQYPDEVKPHIAMVEIAIVDLKDIERGTRIYERGMSTLIESKAQEALSRFYIASCSRLAGTPAWLKHEQERVIDIKRATPDSPSDLPPSPTPLRGKAR